MRNKDRRTATREGATDDILPPSLSRILIHLELISNVDWRPSTANGAEKVNIIIITRAVLNPELNGRKAAPSILKNPVPSARNSSLIIRSELYSRLSRRNTIPSPISTPKSTYNIREYATAVDPYSLVAERTASPVISVL
jgi:hypothetical protein